MVEAVKRVTSRYGIEGSWTLQVAEKLGAYQVARQAFGTMSPEEIKAEMTASNMRGRGGAGFPTGVKWGFIKPKPGEVVYLVVNADEGEPGTFKDRSIMENDPHRVLEGILLASYALGAHDCYLYLRCELDLAWRRLQDALQEAEARGYFGARPFGIEHPIRVCLHPGAGAYICGEETALLNSLQGYRGEPRLKPPFPAQRGLFGMPTLVNNVESIAEVVDVVQMGGAAWSNLSRLPGDGGSRLYGVSGHVKQPGIYEAPVGLTLRELVFDFGGGMLDANRALKAIIPGGASTPVIKPNDTVQAPNAKQPLHAWHGKSHLDVPMGVDTFRALGSMLGTCGAIVIDDSVSMVDVAHNLMRFYRHESCGQCTPCREGTGWLVDGLQRVCAGKGTPADVHTLVDIANNMMGNTICAFADGTAMPLLALVQKFSHEFIGRTTAASGMQPGVAAGVA